MKQQHPMISSQRGAIIPLVAVGLLAMLGMIGLALDLGDAYVNKTRLQNVVDAMALSAALTLNSLHDTDQAKDDALKTFDSFVSQDGNSPLQSFDKSTFVFEFSDTLIPFAPSSFVDPRFVRVTAPTFSIPSFFIRVLGIDNKTVAATAVSGPLPFGKDSKVCDVAPVMMCAEMDADGNVADPDCSDEACYGYNLNEERSLKGSPPTGQDWGVGSGNFRLIRLGDSQGASDVGKQMAGEFDACLDTSDQIETEPGQDWGQVVKGMNTRFGEYKGLFSGTEDEYPPDLVSNLQNPDTSDPSDIPLYPQYQDKYRNGDWDHSNGAPERRIVAVPFADCSTSINGQGTLPLVGMGCFFLTRELKEGGGPEKKIWAELVDSCLANGRPNPNDAGNTGAPSKIVLFKDPDGQDS